MQRKQAGKQEILFTCKEEHFHQKRGQILDQVARRECTISIFGDAQNTNGQALRSMT